MVLDFKSNEVDSQSVVKQMVISRGYNSVTQFCDRELEVTRQAFTTKLKNNSLKFKDFLELADKMGYDVQLVSRE